MNHVEKLALTAVAIVLIRACEQLATADESPMGCALEVYRECRAEPESPLLWCGQISIEECGR